VYIPLPNLLVHCRLFVPRCILRFQLHVYS